MKKSQFIIWLVVFGTSAFGAKIPTMYKNPSCVCCSGHATILKDATINVKLVEVEDMHAIKEYCIVP